MAKRLAAARQALVEVVDFIVAHAATDPNAAFAGSVPYLMLAGNVMAGWQLARSYLVVQKHPEDSFMKAKAVTARFYADHILSKAPGLRDSIVEGAGSVTDMALEDF
jgi:hypothetical protein